MSSPLFLLCSDQMNPKISFIFNVMIYAIVTIAENGIIELSLMSKYAFGKGKKKYHRLCYLTSKQPNYIKSRIQNQQSRLEIAKKRKRIEKEKQLVTEIVSFQNNFLVELARKKNLKKIMN